MKLNQRLRNMYFRVGFYAIQYMCSHECEVACNSVQCQLRKIQPLIWESTYGNGRWTEYVTGFGSCELVCWHEFLWNIFKYFNICGASYHIPDPTHMASSLKKLRKICGASQSPAHISDWLFSKSQVFSEGFSHQIPWPMTLAPTNEAISRD